MIIKQKIRFRLRAAIVLLTLALGWLSTPLALSAWEPDVCEMECCIAEGHCCCATRRPYVKGKEPKPGEVAFNFETELTGPCPAACPVSGVSAKNKLFSVAREQASLALFAAIQPVLYWRPILPDHQSTAQPSSPRSPPSSRA
jgi:hypothetical protein